MAWVTIEEAQENLRMWLEAEKAVATGQSYKIGSRSLTRANLSDITERIKFWRNEVANLERGSDGGVGVVRIVPMDL